MRTKIMNGIIYKKATLLFSALLVFGLSISAQSYNDENEFDYLTYQSADIRINPDLENLNYFWLSNSIAHKYLPIKSENNLTTEILFDDALIIEPWMTDVNIFDEIIIEDKLTNEEHLFIEQWMIEGNLFNTSAHLTVDSDEKLYVEDWMLEQEFFSKSDDYHDLKVEAWMINNDIWAN